MTARIVSANGSTGTSAIGKAGDRIPPVDTRFTKGVSGNPKGRPKGRKSLRALFEAILDQKIKVRDGNRVRSISKAEALFSMMVNAGLKGDLGTGLKAVALASRVQAEAEKETYRAKGKFTNLTNEEIIQVVLDRKLTTQMILALMSDEQLKTAIDCLDTDIKSADG